MSSRMRGTFDWESIKGDKFKDHFLGQSAKLQSSWYLRHDEVPKDSSDSLGPDEQTLRAIQAQEEEYMQEALGIRRKRRRSEGVSLEKSEVEELLRRDEEEARIGSLEDSAEYVAGLGYDERPLVEHVEEKDLLPVSKKYLGPELPPSFRRRDADDSGNESEEDETKPRHHHHHHHHRHHNRRHHRSRDSGESDGEKKRKKRAKKAERKGKEGKEGKEKRSRKERKRESKRGEKEKETALD